VELTFEVNQMAFRVQGEVRSLRSNTEFGFQFRNLSGTRTNQIRDLIEELNEAARKRSEGQP
jgi:hypothetical protein